MAQARVLILKAAGINCDAETAAAFEQAGGFPVFVHINELISGARSLSDFQVLAFSGGFTYGDDIAAGRVLANQVKNKLMPAVRAFIDKGGLIIGICNGFQVLVKAGLLPGTERAQQEVTLAENDVGVFQDRWVYLRRLASNAAGRKELCVWTRGLSEIVTMPIAHGEGKFIPKNEELLTRLKEGGQIVFQYCDARGCLGDFPINPNGSVDSIAGICDETGRVFGLMPHPERHLTGLQHPSWTRDGLKRHGDGFYIFQNAVRYFQ